MGIPRKCVNGSPPGIWRNSGCSKGSISHDAWCQFHPQWYICIRYVSLSNHNWSQYVWEKHLSPAGRPTMYHGTNGFLVLPRSNGLYFDPSVMLWGWVLTRVCPRSTLLFPCSSNYSLVSQSMTELNSMSAASQARWEKWRSFWQIFRGGALSSSMNLGEGLVLLTD